MHQHTAISSEFIPDPTALRAYLTKSGWINVGVDKERNAEKYVRAGVYVHMPLDPDADDFHGRYMLALLELSLADEDGSVHVIPPEALRTP